MFLIRAFVGDRLTQEYITTCNNVGVNMNLLRESLVDRIKDVKAQHENMEEYAVIRLIHEQLKEENYIKSHIAVMFNKHLSTISQILHNPNRGAGQVGRHRLLTRDQEDRIVQFVRNCQISGHCVTFAEVTKWVNEDFEMRIPMRLPTSRVDNASAGLTK